MKKILLGTSAILGALTLVASSASAQTAKMMQDQKPGMKGSVGGSIAAILTGGAAQKVNISLPNWRNYISVKADGTAAGGVTYGAYLRLRSGDKTVDSKVEADKAYAYLGYKFLGTFTMGRNNTELGNNTISPTDLVPGYSVDGDANTGGAYGWDNGRPLYDITGRDKPMGISYVTPSIYGVKIGYTYSSPYKPGSASNSVSGAQDFEGNNLANTHDVVVRYDGAFGPVTLGVMGGYRASGVLNADNILDTAADSTGFVAGAQLGYSDGKNIGFNINGNYTSESEKDSAGTDSGNSWGVGLSFDTPRVAGLTLGLMYGGATANGATNGQFGVGLGYAWSENFSQTFGYDMVTGDTTGKKSSWVLASQVSF